MWECVCGQKGGVGGRGIFISNSFKLPKKYHRAEIHTHTLAHTQAHGGAPHSPGTVCVWVSSSIGTLNAATMRSRSAKREETMTCS